MTRVLLATVAAILTAFGTGTVAWHLLDATHTGPTFTAPIEPPRAPVARGAELRLTPPSAPGATVSRGR